MPSGGLVYMFCSLIHWNIILAILLKTIIISIPEEFYIIMLTLILMREFDYWKEEECKKIFDRWDYFRVFIPVIASALVPNILRYLKVDIDIVSLVSMATALILIILTGDIWGDSTALKWIGKAFLFLLVAVLTVQIIEYSYIPFFIYGSGKTIEQINGDIVLLLFVSLPARIMQYAILAFLYAKKRTLLQGKILNTIFKSKGLTIFSSILVVSNIAYMVTIIKTICFGRILSQLPADLRTIVIIATFIFPLLNIIIFLGSIYYVKNKETENQDKVTQKLNDLSNELESYTDLKDYDNIRWKLYEFQKKIDTISKDLYNVDSISKKGVDN